MTTRRPEHPAPRLPPPTSPEGAPGAAAHPAPVRPVEGRRPGSPAPLPRGTRVLSFVAVLLLLAFAAGVVAALRLRERQQPIVTLLETIAAADPAQRQAARTTLLKDPARNAPVLVAIIRRGKNRWHGEILPWLDEIPPLANRRSRQLVLERHAIDILQRMGPAAAPHVLELLVETRYGGRDTAIALLRAYGTPVCPFLVQALDHHRPLIRAGAVATLGRFPSSELESLDPLRRAAADTHPAVRASAVWALGQMHDRAADIIPDLIRALADPAPEVPVQAATALRFFGPQSVDAIPALRRCLGASADVVRANAALTLGAIGGEAARTAAPELLLALRQRDGPSARLAAVTLVQLDQHRSEALDRLRGFLRHRDGTVRSRTLDAVRGLGPRGEPLVPAIQALLDDGDDRDNRPALAALRSIQPSAIPERFRQGRRSP